MKTLQNLSKVLAVVLLGTLMVFAAKQTVEFEVKGACGMCETRIEQTAKGLDGVKKADWDLETQVLTLKFNDKKVSLVDVRKALAAVGHDNGDFRASDKVYENLPACCHYEREDAKKAGDCASGNCSEEKQTTGMKMSVEEESSCGSTCGEEEKSACESGSCEEPEK
jgi:periplasmic mercuric ion binding protein